MIPIKSGSQKGGVLSQPLNMGSGKWQPSAQDLPDQFLFLFMMRKEPGGFFVCLFVCFSCFLFAFFLDF